MRKFLLVAILLSFSSGVKSAGTNLSPTPDARYTPVKCCQNRCVLVTSTGTIVVFYAWPGAKNNLVYRVSTDGGSNWSDATAVPSSPAWYNFYFHVIIDSNDHLYVVYEGADGRCFFRKLTYNGDNTWSLGTEYEFQTAQNGLAHPCLVREPGGRIWASYHYTDASGNTYLYAKYTDNEGANWSTPYTIVSAPPNENSLLLLKDNQYPACFWGYYTPLRWSYWNGSSWSAPADISGTTTVYHDFSGVVTDNNYIHLTLRKSTTIYHLYYNTTTWSSLTSVVDLQTSSQNTHSLTTDGNLIWLFYRDNAHYFHRKQYYPATNTWDASSEVILSDGATNLNPNTPEKVRDNPEKIPLLYSLDGSTDYVKFLSAPFCKWIYPSTGNLEPIYSSPRAFQGTVYIATDSNSGSGIKGRIYAINGADGSLKWTYENSTTGYYYHIRSSPAVYIDSETNRNILIFGDDGGRLYKIRDDGTTPTELWVVTLSAGNPIRSSPIVNSSRNKIFVGCDDGNVYGVDENGAVLSNWPVNLEADSDAPVRSTGGMYIADDYLYIGSNEGKVYKIATGTGAITNSFPATPTSGVVVKTPVFIRYDGTTATLYYGESGGTTTNRGLVALNCDTFAERGTYNEGTTFDIAAGIFSPHSPYGTNNKVYVAREDVNTLYCLNDDGTTGTPFTLVSSFTTDGGTNGIIYSTPLVWNGYVYFGTNNGDFYALSENTLTLKSGFPKSNSQGSFQSSPCYDRTNNIFIIADTVGKVYAYSP
jgi:outer membrane protein assembly factor BamB